jgi:hypothetical protein
VVGYERLACITFQKGVCNEITKKKKRVYLIARKEKGSLSRGAPPEGESHCCGRCRGFSFLAEGFPLLFCTKTFQRVISLQKRRGGDVDIYNIYIQKRGGINLSLGK